MTSYLVRFQNYRRLLFKFWTLFVFEPPPLGGLGATHITVHLRLIEKRVVDFLLVIKLFSLSATPEALRAIIDCKLPFFKGGGSVSGKFCFNFTRKILSQQEIRSMERASAQCVAFRMPKQVVMY